MNDPSRRRIAKSVRISAELDARLKQVAVEREVGVNRLITRAIEQYLDHLPVLDAPSPPIPLGRCESCGRRGDCRLDDGSWWCASCDLAARAFEADETT